MCDTCYTIRCFSCGKKYDPNHSSVKLKSWCNSDNLVAVCAYTDEEREQLVSTYEDSFAGTLVIFCKGKSTVCSTCIETETVSNQIRTGGEYLSGVPHDRETALQDSRSMTLSLLKKVEDLERDKAEHRNRIIELAAIIDKLQDY
jgi:hypothetical protein